MSNINYCTAKSDKETIVIKSNWTVPNFVEYLKNPPRRQLRKTVDPEFLLRMQIVGYNYSTIEIYFLSLSTVVMKAILNLGLKSGAMRQIASTVFYTVQENKWQYLNTLFSHDFIQTPLNCTAWGRSNCVDIPLRNGNLYLEFQFEVTHDIKDGRACVPESQLADDFGSILNDDTFSDVLMKSVDGTEYKVHKVILASRSLVFKAHFHQDTTKSITNIESPFEADVLLEVLKFIYSDKAPGVNDIPEKLLVAAEFYQLSGLKKLCEDVLHKNLTVKNVIKTIELADLYSAKTLKQSCLEFIKYSQSELLITKTEAWSNIKSIDLIKSIYEYILADEVNVEKVKSVESTSESFDISL
ncbi:uncharacterized protein LOC126971433 [Leptidea sinapis]|uniref:uncharacterized protein LOC126971433 n=1 Tax=Leptidea sinapis TaxID=189913 RepID=UPI00212E345C|nr:uncharacterized protein LOC126971433 [Leptidea sinapis]